MARTSPALAQEFELARCIRRVAGGRTWLEKTLWGLRDQEGGWNGAQILNSDGSFDLGPLQINSRWISRIAVMTDRPAASVRWWLVHDTCFNVDAARWIFLSGLGPRVDYWRAVGAYHSPTVWRQRMYASGVADRLQRRFGPAIFSSRGRIR
ncbi:lytic transglycosylase domain-containing protein [Sphingomonas sp. CGMCC 1.13654]|uniref:Lytic transglycosylase domain-containing protein n=1 Tax=Sphingomonas chungangi TaxID=2683589 RepID=A0A838L949_9SPHN|nr:lytic transglycosylase domain-containing protein [Sphingomonas chungangi]MVW55313.1 murein transglycosylase [Sphingomonas chungangi]